MAERPVHLRHPYRGEAAGHRGQRWVDVHENVGAVWIDPDKAVVWEYGTAQNMNTHRHPARSVGAPPPALTMQPHIQVQCGGVDVTDVDGSCYALSRSDG
jgi:hypothetical protein